MKISKQVELKIKEIITTHLMNDGDDQESAIEEAEETISKLKEGTISFLLWDSLGCDDAGIRENSPEIEKLYNKITKTWIQSQKSNIQ